MGKIRQHSRNLSGASGLREEGWGLFRIFNYLSGLKTFPLTSQPSTNGRW